MTQPDRPFADEPTEVLQAALDLANRHARQAARFRPAQDGDPLPAVTELLQAELQQRSQTLPPPQGPEYTPCGCGHIEPEHRPDAGPCLKCDCGAYLPAAMTQPDPDLRDRIAQALLDHLSRTADIRPGRSGDLAFMPEITDTERLRIAEHLAAVLPAPDQRAVCAQTFVVAANYVRGVSADRRFDNASVSTALCVVSDELRRLAGEAQQDPAPPSVALARRSMEQLADRITVAQQDPAPGGEAVCTVAGCGHDELAHGITGCRDCPRGQRAFHLFTSTAVARSGQPETDGEAADRG